MYAAVAVAFKYETLACFDELAQHETDEFSGCIAVAAIFLDDETIDIGRVKHLGELCREEAFAAPRYTHHHDRIGAT